MNPRGASRSGIVGWLLYDWAQQPFATLILTFVFAPFFASAVAANPVEGQALWGYATAAAGLVMALLAPILGSIADATGPKKPWIAACGVILVIASCALWFVVPGASHAVWLALIAFAIGTVAMEIGAVFNNAMMVHLVPASRLGRLSGDGAAIGYVAGLVSIVVVLGFLAASPETGRTLFGLAPLFGLDPAMREGDRASGPFSALWFIVFALPLFLFTPDVRTAGRPLTEAVRTGLAKLSATLSEVRRDRNLLRFLIGHMVYQDGLVAIFAFGGIYGAGVFGWSTIELGLFGIMLTIVAAIGAAIGGRIDDSVGAKRVIIGCILLLIVVALGVASIGKAHILFVIPVAPPHAGDGLFASVPEQMFMALGLVIGLVVGPIQASARSLLARLAPPEESGRMFGLLALSGKVTSFLAPLLIAIATDLSGTQAAAPLVVIAFFIVGWLVLRKVAEPGRTS